MGGLEMGRSELTSMMGWMVLHLLDRLAHALSAYRSLRGRTSHHTVPAIAAPSCQPPRPTNNSRGTDCCCSPCSRLSKRSQVRATEGYWPYWRKYSIHLSNVQLNPLSSSRIAS